MATLEKIYNVLAYELKVPKMYGLFHLLSLAFIVILTIILCKTAQNTSEKTERKIAFGFWIALFILESYKQFIYHFNADEFILDYGWQGFPFQLCSAPLYVLPVIAFLPSGKIREAFAAFYGTFVLLGGLAVCIYPGNVLVEKVGINIHTMFWHGSQVFLGVYFNLRRFASNNASNLKKFFLSAIPIFLSFVTVAVILNDVFYNYLTARGCDDEFNLFFISRHFVSSFPVFDIIQLHTPYPVFLLSYIVVLSASSFALILAEKAIIDSLKKHNKL